MPYKSAKQRAYLHINHPEIAKRWDKEYGGKIGKSKSKVKKKTKGSVTRRLLSAR